MTARRAPPPNSLVEWGMKNAALLFTVLGLLVTFYFTTKNQLDNHEKQFVEIAKKFDTFNKSQNDNFAAYTVNQKEEKQSADRAREAIQQAVNSLTAGQAAGNVKLEVLGKQLDTIQSNQRLPPASRK